MSQTHFKANKETIMAGFEKLLLEYQQGESKIATKEEEAEKSKNQKLLNKTIDYTVDNIINAMASLQLNFGSTINELAENLTSESNKLAELKKAIAVEQEHLQQLNKVRLIADALHILNQEHQERNAILKAETARKKEILEKEMAQTRKDWAKEQLQFEARVQEIAELSIKQREEEAADYQYELERQRTIENDEYEENKRLQLRELAELEASKNQDWSEREKYLVDNQAEFTKNQEQINGFEEKLKEEYSKAKAKAIKDADNKYKIETDLREKEWLATQQGYELKIESLTAIIEQQNEQVAEITTQLQAVNSQAQNLAMQAFQNTAK